MDIEGMIDELFEKIYEIEKLVEEKEELVVEDDCYPGGRYLVVRKLSSGGVAIERGEYGRWQESLTIILER